MKGAMKQSCEDLALVGHIISQNSRDKNTEEYYSSKYFQMIDSPARLEDIGRIRAPVLDKS